MAQTFAGQNSYDKAVQCQYWVVQKTDDGRYDLACWESRAGRTDAAFYWLQEAARLDSVHARWANEDSDLARLRSDDRWEKLAPFLKQCETYWRAKRP